MEDVITDSVAAPDLLDRSEWLPESFKQQQAQTGELLIAYLVTFSNPGSNLFKSPVACSVKGTCHEIVHQQQRMQSGVAAGPLCSVHKCEAVVCQAVISMLLAYAKCQGVALFTKF